MIITALFSPEFFNAEVWGSGRHIATGEETVE